MIDMSLNLVIVLFALAIFIGRTVVAARKKHKPASKKAPAPAPVQVKKEDDDLPHWLREPAHAKKAAAAPKQKAARNLRPNRPKAGDLAAFIESHASVSAAIPVPEGNIDPEGSRRQVPVKEAPARAILASLTEKPAAVSSGGSLFNLGKLSPLKQAVVMAEILGPPKGLQ